MSIDLYKPDTGEELDDALIANDIELQLEDSLTTWPDGVLTEIDLVEDLIRSYEQIIALGDRLWDDAVLLEYTLRGLSKAYGLNKDVIDKNYVNRLIQNVLSSQLIYSPGVNALKRVSEDVEGERIIESKDIGVLKLELVEPALHKYQLVLLSRPKESGARLGIMKTILFSDEAEARLVYDEIDSENDIGYLSRFSNESFWKDPKKGAVDKFIDMGGIAINVGDNVVIQRNKTRGEVIELDKGSNEVIVAIGDAIEFYHPSELKVLLHSLHGLKKVSYSKSYEEYVKFGKSDPDLLLKIYREDKLSVEQIETAIDRKDQLELLYTLQQLDNLHINKAIEVGDDLDTLVTYQKLTFDQTNKVNVLLGETIKNDIENSNNVTMEKTNDGPTVIVIK